ncbi:hypothetical protein GGQ84_000443 [Desulfitispora alkaliphila]|uniref:hypothetical protein n=1 Tax=Desulfitispora alkaliphila TaxID=622674 RepID=UPI003D1FDBC5
MINKKGNLSKNMMKKLAEDLSDLIDTEEGCLLALKLFETIPWEARVSLLRNLSVVHSPYVGVFFKLILREYSTDSISAEAKRALNKLQMAGIDIEEIHLNLGEFSKEDFEIAMASKSRLEGHVNLLVAFRNESSQTYNAFFFMLSFDKFGIRDFYRSTELSMEQLESAKSDEKYEEVGFEQALILVNHAFKCNEENDTLPAIGLSIYKDFLELALAQGEYKVKNEILGNNITPTKTVNAFCLAERQGDRRLIEQLSGGKYSIREEGVILQSKILNIEEDGEVCNALAELILDSGAELWRIHWKFSLRLTSEKIWKITHLDEVLREQLDWNWLEEVISDNKVSAVFEVFEWEKVQSVLESFYGVELFQAGEDMMFYKWWELDNVLENGIDLRKGVKADFILHEDELVVAAENSEKLEHVLDIFEEEFDEELELLDTIVPLEIEYTILDQDNISLSQLLYQWELTGKDKDEKLSSWLSTKLVDLNGMTPIEAKESSEGSHLLWALFKDMQRKQVKLRRNGDQPIIDYRQLIKAVGWGKKTSKEI